MRRWLRPVALAALLAGAVAPTVGASEEWCSTDPLLLLQTPGGALVPVYVATVAPLDVQADLLRAGYRYDRAPAGLDGTRFTIHVTVPDDLLTGRFALQDAVSAGPSAGVGVMLAAGGSRGRFQAGLAAGGAYARAGGTSGETVDLTFTYPAP